MLLNCTILNVHFVQKEGKQTLTKFYSRTMCVGEQPFLNEHKQCPESGNPLHSVSTHSHLPIPHILAGPGNRGMGKTAMIARPLQVHSLAMKICVGQVITTKYGSIRIKCVPA